MTKAVNFHPTTQKSKNVTSMGYFCSKYMRFELKKYEGLFFMVLSSDVKFWFQKQREKLGELCYRALKSLKNCTLTGSFCPKHMIQELCVMILKGDAKFLKKLTCDLKNNIRNLVKFHASSQKSENLNFDWIILSKAYNDLSEKIQKS